MSRPPASRPPGSRGIRSLLTRPERQKPEPPAPRPRLYATVEQFGDVIVCCGEREPEDVEADLWAGKLGETIEATSIWYYGSKKITVRSSAIVATVIEARGRRR